MCLDIKSILLRVYYIFKMCLDSISLVLEYYSRTESSREEID